MKIIVANRDRTADLGAEIRTAAANRQQNPDCRVIPATIVPEISALALQAAKSESAYLSEFIRLLRYRDNVDTLRFMIPRKPGFQGAMMTKLKEFLWKLLRYQHDRITFRQNMINSLHTTALECELAAREKDVSELRKRLAELEARLNGPDANRSKGGTP